MVNNSHHKKRLLNREGPSHSSCEAHFYLDPHASIPDRVRSLAIEKTLALIDTPRSLAVWLMWSQGSHDDIVALPFPSNPETFHKDYIATKLLSKASFLKLSSDRAKVAMNSFWESERQCAQSNLHLRNSGSGQSPATNLVLYHASRKIARILGPFPGSGYFEGSLVGWGPGSTSACKGREVASQYKYQARLDTTSAAAASVLRTVRHYDLWGAASEESDGPLSILPAALNMIRGNKLHLVPKNAKTDRVICVEPHCNSVLQKAVGDYIRRCLLKTGCNLLDQSINQKRARIASITDNLATIDLKGASDTISIELVRALLPDDWFSYLDSLRSHYTNVDGRWVRLEKFSSMGNGFTFELESLIFLAISRCFSDDVSVYGDDIIVDSSVANSLIKAFELCGFSVNTGKTYISGPFKESCGSDFYNGIKVSPTYIKDLSTVANYVSLHNSLRDRLPNVRKRDLFWYRSLVSAPQGCAGYGDYHYHVDFDELNPILASTDIKRTGWEGYLFETFLPRPIKSRTRVGFYSALAAKLGPKAVRSLYGSRVLRGSVKFKLGRVVATQWHNSFIPA